MKYRFDEKRALFSFFPSLLIYGSVLLILIYFLYPELYLLKHGVIVTLTVFALWRYGWMILNYSRALLYRYWLYPRLKQKALALPEDAKYPANLYFMIPSYKEDSWVSVECFRSILSEIKTVPSRVTIVIATSSTNEDAVIHQMFKAYDGSNKVKLIFQHQNSGKRIAMGHALRSIARVYHKEHFEDPNSVTIFMDGDSYLEKGFLHKVLPFFASEHRLGALTTNEAAFINTESRWYKEWFNLKFGQRHIMFQSHSLSKKVMTLTGRLSLYRTGVVVKESFISQVENDIITDPLHGKFRFLMGDDKSTWFYMLKNGWDMLYIPDALCISLESRDGDFLELSRSLPYRWFGNTLRNNSRALQLGPKKVGWYIWYAILDQRLVMWTSLVGLVSAIILSVVYSPLYLLFFFAWVVMIRLFQLFVIAFFGHRVNWRMVPLLLYTQWVGALIKIKAFYNLSDQSWSKNNDIQKSGNTQRAHIDSPLVPWMPKIIKYTAVTLFLTALLVSHGALSLPDMVEVKHFLNFSTSNSMQLNAALYDCNENKIVLELEKHGIKPGKKDCSVEINALLEKYDSKIPLEILFEEGTYLLKKPIHIHRSNVHLKGKGKGKTVLYSLIRGKHESVIDISGRRLKKAGYLAQNLYHNQTAFQIITKKELSKYLLVRQPNDPLFLQKLGSKKWSRRYPYIRQEIVEVLEYDPVGKKVFTTKPVLTDFEAAKTEIYNLEMVENIFVEDMTLLQSYGRHDPQSVRFDFTNAAPEVMVDTVSLQYAAHCRISNVEILQSGSHPVSMNYCYQILLEGLDIDGSWNKGKKGNGYVRFARTFYSVFRESTVKNIRHITLQWSSAGNHLYKLQSEVDINLHGGYAHDNKIDRITFRVPKRHKWKPLTFVPDDAHWAPPDGKNDIDYKTIRYLTKKD